MYQVILHGTAWARDNGEYKQIETRQHFMFENTLDLSKMIGNMAKAAEDELKLTISWKEESDD